MNSVASQYKENNGTISVNAVVNDAASLIPRKEDGAIDVAAIGNMAKDRVVEAYEDGKAKALTAKDYITGEKVLEETPIEESEKVTFDRAYKAAMAVFEDARNGTMSLDSMVDSADTITKYIDQTKTTMKNTAIRAFNGIRSGFSKK